MADIQTGTTERTYKTLVTDIGKAKMALAALNGEKVNITEAAAGDGGGSYCTPTAAQTKLVSEVWRGEIANKSINAESANMVDVKVSLPSDVGGWTVREIGLFDSAGDLIVIANTPDTEKALITTGAAASLDLILHVVFTDVDTVTFTVNQNLDQVTAADVQKMIEEHNEDPNAHGGIGNVVLTDITIPVSGWEPDGDEFFNDVVVEDATEELYPSVTIYRESLAAAKAAGLCPTVQITEGAIRFWSEKVPAEDLSATVALFYQSGAAVSSGSIPVATSSTLGGVKIQDGSGLTIDSDGNLSLDAATTEEVSEIFNQE